VPSFLPYSWRVVLGGLAEVLLNWVVFSAIISATLVITDWIIYTPMQALSGGQVQFSLSSLTTAHLKTLPQFRYLDYYQYLWVGLVVVIAIASLIYSISLAQKEDSEVIIKDFYSEVASTAVTYVGLVLVVWILGFIIYGMFLSHEYGIMYNDSTLAQIMAEGQEGLKTLAGSDISARLMWVFEGPYPYIPAPAFFLAYVYVLRNAHTGWLGNVWAQVAR